MTQTATYTSPRYISVADTAKLIRTALKESFPSIKFSVRSKSYAGGASIRVEWFDGPTDEEVAKITKRFEGATFDGMIDLKSSQYSELNGERVHFGADYVNTARQLSIDFLTKVTTWYCKRFGYAMPIIKASKYDASGYIDGDYYIPRANEWLATLIYRETHKISADDVDKIDAMYARKDAEDEARYQAYLTEKEAQTVESVEQVEEKVNEGIAIVQTANDLYGEIEAPTFYIYASVYRPMSASWARIPGARFVNAAKESGAHTWIVVHGKLDKAMIDSYELTPEPVYVVGEAQEEVQEVPASSPVVGYSNWCDTVCCSCVRECGLDVQGWNILTEAQSKEDDGYECDYCAKTF